MDYLDGKCAAKYYTTLFSSKLGKIDVKLHKICMKITNNTSEQLNLMEICMFECYFM